MDDEGIRSGIPFSPPSPLFRATRRGFGAGGGWVVFASGWDWGVRWAAGVRRAAGEVRKNRRGRAIYGVAAGGWGGVFGLCAVPRGLPKLPTPLHCTAAPRPPADGRVG